MSAKYKTCIVSVFPGCGKTWMYNHQHDDDMTFYTIHSYTRRHLKIQLCDATQYQKNDGWEKHYVDDLLDCNGNYDFVFASMHPSILEELKFRHIPFVMVLPQNYGCHNERERILIKQQFLGRIVLSNNSLLTQDFGTKIKSLSEHYDNWIKEDIVWSYNPVCTYLLGEGTKQYVADIIGDLFDSKEDFPERYCLPLGNLAE